MLYVEQYQEKVGTHRPPPWIFWGTQVPIFPFLLVTVMTDRRTKNHFRYSGTEAPVKETSPLPFKG